MNRTMKILAVMLLVITMTMFFSSNVLAFAVPTPTTSGSSPSDIISGLETATNSASVDTGKFTQTAGKIIKLLRNFSVIAGVILIIVLGVKYMMGSVEQKSDYQKSFVPLVIGIILVIGATSIASFLFSLM